MNRGIEDEEFWFFTGSQHLYGPETLAQVAKDSAEIVAALNASGYLPGKLVCREVLTRPDEVTQACQEVSANSRCAGVIFWMHTFSPAKMWIAGLQSLTKPFLDFHTQFGRDIPWDSIDMDFMNLHQTAHGGREFGHLGARLRIGRKVVVGHWQEEETQKEVATWMRVAAGWAESRRLKVARFGDNMRQVAVTDGDKVAAQIKFGWEVNGYGVGELREAIDLISEEEVDSLCARYALDYQLAQGLEAGGERHDSLREAARIELGLRKFLEEGGYGAFTTTFEDLHGIRQLPGLAVQRLMADGYGFGAEGDWKTAALLRVAKVMARGLPGGTVFMEDYTYHLDPAQPMILGSHMLELCPSMAEGEISIEVHPLGIGGKEDPCRMVFTGATGPAVNASLVDVGGRFRMILNEVNCVQVPEAMPKLPVARVLWEPAPNLKVATEAWIRGGGAHHTVLSYSLTTSMFEDWCEMAGVELAVIDKRTTLREFTNTLRTSEIYFMMANGLRG